MVNIDTVYQRVLAFANKEQRGYITPQEFNLFANQAQMEIFEQYFYDVNQFNRIPGNSTEYSDMRTILNEKIGLFKTSSNPVFSTQPINHFPMPFNLYRLGTVHYGNGTLDNQIEVTEVNNSELPYIGSSPLAKPTITRPVFVTVQEGIQIYPSISSGITLTYIRTPLSVNWTYTVVGEKALVNPSPLVGYQDFELHLSEETELVYKILKFAGIAIQKDDIMRAGQGLEMAKVQQEKS